MKLPGRDPGLRARRKALKAQAQARRAALRAELARRRKAGGRPDKRARRRRWLVLVLLLLLLLLLEDCRCSVPPETSPVPAPAPVAGEEVEVEPPPAPITGRIPRKARPAFEVDPPAPLPWLPAFRLQVAARSPRLAQCFLGVERPGRLKWTSTVEPGEGLVSDHELETMLAGEDLTRTQRACVLEVLSEPPYSLDGDQRSTPSRVGMVIEF